MFMDSLLSEVVTHLQMTNVADLTSAQDVAWAYVQAHAHRGPTGERMIGGLPQAAVEVVPRHLFRMESVHLFQLWPRWPHDTKLSFMSE